MVDALERAVRAEGDNAALTYFGRSFTFSEIQAISSALAAGLEGHGVGKGDRVLVQLQNVPQFIFTTLAAWTLGAIVVPVSPMYRVPEVRKIVSDSGPKVFITSNDVWALQGPESIAGSEIRLVLTTGFSDFAEVVPAVFASITDSRGADGSQTGTVDFADFVRENDRRLPSPVEVAKTDTALFCYTSGTTGDPKAAEVSHSNLTWTGSAYPLFGGVDGPDQVLLGLAPLVHITGLALHIGAWLSEASRLVLSYRFDPDLVMALIEEEKVTWTTGAATAYISLLRSAVERPRDTTSIQLLGSGGAPIPADVARRVRDVFGVGLSTGYGLTESTCVSTSTPPADGARIDSDSGIISVGTPIFETRVRIVDDGGADVATGVRGEVYVAGPGIVTSYWNNPTATAELLSDGWLRTGDVGFLDDDGWLYIVDRTKNMIIASGYKVWPREVEEVLYSHPAVKEAAVVGVPDEYRGETVKAFVSLAGHLEVSAAELIDYCRGRLAAYKVPKAIEVIAELPKNPNGKILHNVLRDSSPTS